MNLSNNLKRIRKEHNLSQEQLAEKLGVSRQSVSKWESGQAYPEMDKVLQICQLFKVNIDDLMNQDIKEVNNIKQSKNNVNKFIDDFLDYITKTIDMFSSMKFKEKVKCLFEQCVIAFFIGIVLLVLVLIISNIFRNILNFLPGDFYYPIYNMVEGTLLMVALILGVILILYIFKVRYLDYYVVIKEENTTDISNTNEEDNKEGKIVLEKKQEKIVIRDPKHSGYKFISGLLRCFLFIIKLFIIFIAILFCISLVFLSICLLISFAFVKTGLLFVGLFISFIAAIIINLIILKLLYDFILSKKNSKGKLAISFAASLIAIGFGIGMFSLGITNFDIVFEGENEYFVSSEQVIPMRNDLFFENYYSHIDYIESDNNDIRIVYNNSNLYEIYMEEHKEGYLFHLNLVDSNVMKNIRQFIEDFNNKKIVDYSHYTIKIYTTKENIKILEENLYNHWNNY